MKANWKNHYVQSSFFLQFKSKTRLKSCMLELNFVSDFAQVGEVRYIAYCNMLAVNNNPLEDFPFRLLFCHRNKPVVEHTYDRGTLAHLNWNLITCSMSISPSFFFNSILSRKNRQDVGELLLKHGTIIGYAY